jgi:hypothetical protein
MGRPFGRSCVLAGILLKGKEMKRDDDEVGAVDEGDKPTFPGFIPLLTIPGIKHRSALYSEIMEFNILFSIS